jgi:hypothetical protein
MKILFFYRLKKTKNLNWDTLSSRKQKATAKEQKKSIKKSVKKIDDDESSSTVSLDPRSDLSDEDEMMDALIDTFRRMSGDENRDLKSLNEELRKIRETVADSLDDILEETESEMNLKLDGLERHHAIDQVSFSFFSQLFLLKPFKRSICFSTV